MIEIKKLICYVQDQINDKAVSFRSSLWWQMGKPEDSCDPENCSSEYFPDSLSYKGAKIKKKKGISNILC